MNKRATKRLLLLKHHRRALKRPVLPTESAKVALRCAGANGDPRGFWLQLGERERRDRERRAAARRRKAATCPTIPTLEDFDFLAQPAANKPLGLAWLRGHSLDRRENVLLVGSPGTGKPPRATALAVAAGGPGQRVRFGRVTERVTQLLEAREERGLQRWKAQLGRLDLLVLDELGYVPTRKRGAELLFDVSSAAYERTSLVVTTTLPFERWGEVLGSERLTGAV